MIRRRIGPIGTASRAAVGLTMLYLAGAVDGLPWDVAWFDPVVGLIAFPALTVLLGLAARRYAAEPIRFTGALGHTVNCAVIVALIANPYTGGAATLFYGTTLLIAAWRGLPGCEMTAISNWILGRDDHVGCPIFLPVDALEHRHQSRRPVTVSD